MNVELHIDELVLRGIGTGREHEIRAAMERELAALLKRNAASEIQRRQSTVDRLDAGSIQVNPGVSAASIGAQLAGSIYRGLLG